MTPESIVSSIEVPHGTLLGFSYATMAIPSNDAVLPNGNPKAFPIFANEGHLRGTATFLHDDVSPPDYQRIDLVRVVQSFFNLDYCHTRMGLPPYSSASRN
jgi:hypothetical protein